MPTEERPAYLGAANLGRDKLIKRTLSAAPFLLLTFISPPTSCF